ncbi:zinc-dependent alcohol dehydrogenase family protein [Microbulbifer sp. TRSA001]|uniref:zinc-dependent alcohol dehydrogenase family protein n=1 Tax=unclassified Microbulbifer TaxID=2619833 RepID=UPI0024AE4692|nr:zinc-dependent alcohol dehydrogenase family protein [Microbulbifer sp. VAAF005]WHI46732.1 zinc-dependent alcohol dehydrogenase family protein [Microbulbifer sp. VAAF005]
MLKAEYQERGPVPQDVIEAVSFDTPELQEGQVLLEMLAAPINPSDVLTLTGDYGMLPPLPAVGGNEGVAKVVKHGPNVTAPAVGQVVLLPVGSGTWATHMVVNAQGLIPLPNNVDPLQLSMITINPPTAYLLLSEFVDLKEGDWVIQNAANSGVGSYLTTLAKLRGLKVINVVRRESLIEPMKAAGADVVLVDGEHLGKRVAEATGGAEIKLGIDAVGGMATARMGEALSNGATLVNYGALSGEPCVITPGMIIFKDITVRGFWLAKWFGSASPERQQEVFGTITKLVAEGKLSAPVHGTYPLSEIKEAVRIAAAGGRDGKVLVVSESLAS